MPSFIAKSPEFEGQVFDLNGEVISIGRTDENQLTIAHPSISSSHAELRFENGDYRLVDLNSTNGSRVNDERISESVLRNQDVVMLGNIILTYQSENTAEASPLPAPENRVAVSSGVSAEKPREFRNLAPFAKTKSGQGSGASLFYVLAILLFLGGAGFYGFKLYSVLFTG